MSKDNLKDYIESKEYFKDARNWYNWKYILPLTHRVWSLYLLLAAGIMLVALVININNLLPIKERLTYGVRVVSDTNQGETQAQVIEMKNFSGVGGPNKFIATNLIRNYVDSREIYDYQDIKKQFSYIQNSSTRMVFKKYHSYMSVNNPDSPVMRYQQYAIRKINIDDVRFISDNRALVKFVSIAKDSNGKIFENLSWEAKIGFNMGEVGKKVKSGSRFKFVVTDYKLRLLGEVK